MAKGEFDFGDAMPVQGIAVVQCMDEEGELRIRIATYGEARTYETVGLLTGALDHYRAKLAGSFEDA